MRFYLAKELTCVTFAEEEFSLVPVARPVSLSRFRSAIHLPNRGGGVASFYSS